MLIGLVLGIVSGAAQFVLLARFSKAVTGDGSDKESTNGFDRKAALIGVGQFFLPFAVLLGCALLLPDALLWAAIGMCATLCIFAVVRFVNTKRG